jgi:hypothetical protein
MVKLTEKHKQIIIEDYAKGFNQYQISSKINVPRSTIQSYMKREGIGCRTKSEIRKNYIKNNPVKSKELFLECRSKCPKSFPHLRTGKLVSCEVCGKPRYKPLFQLNNCKLNFCSATCRRKYFVGEKASSWKGGVFRSKERLLRASPEWRLMRKRVFERDDWTCQECKQTGGQLHPHHIIPKSLRPDLTFEIENVITLCYNCHIKTGKHKLKLEDNNGLIE